MFTPTDQVKRLFIATDNNDYNTVLDIFDTEVELDYSSLSGQPSAVLPKETITTSWKSILPGFTHTHHQIGNIITYQEEENASIFCYGTATHYLEHVDGNIWTVVGSYDFDLVKKETWVITSMKFNFKYQDGNTNLPAIATTNVKGE